MKLFSIEQTHISRIGKHQLFAWSIRDTSKYTSSRHASVLYKTYSHSDTAFYSI